MSYRADRNENTRHFTYDAKPASGTDGLIFGDSFQGSCTSDERALAERMQFGCTMTARTLFHRAKIRLAVAAHRFEKQVIQTGAVLNGLTWARKRPVLAIWQSI